MLFRLLLTCLCACTLAACDGDGDSSGPDELTGVVVGVEARGLADVRAFTLRAGGREREIFIDPRADYEGFPLPHLSDHLASAEPVRVELERRNGKLFARSIADA